MAAPGGNRGDCTTRDGGRKKRKGGVCLEAPDQFVEEERAKEGRGLAPEDVVRMEREMESHAAEFKLIEESHGRNALHLVVGYLKRLTDNARVARYLIQRYPEIQAEFQKLVESPGCSRKRSQAKRARSERVLPQAA